MRLNYTYGEIYSIIKGESLKNDALIRSVAYDTRKIIDGSEVLFFALKGVFRDGHDFLEDAYQKGVRHFVVEDAHRISHNDANIIKVSNSLEALQQLAAYHRSQFNYPVVAITGSNGKTIVKEWLASLLSETYNVVKSPKSYNSQLGVAISLLELHSGADLAIIEAGISHPGEMDSLREMIHPTLGILTNIGTAHLENFESKAQLRDEKLKLFNECKRLISGETLQVEGMEIIPASLNDAEAAASPFQDEISLKNLAIAGTAAKTIGLSGIALMKKIPQLSSLAMRMEQFDGIDGNTIINDTYSLDIDAFRSSLEYQFSIAQGKKRIVIIGLTKKNADTENEFRKIMSEFGDIEYHFHYPDQPFEYSFKNAVILIKGRRAAEMQKIANQFKKRTHATYLEIDLDAIRNNINVFKGQLMESTKMLCMVKAASYGSDASKIGAFLSDMGVDYLGVAYVDEGIELRNVGIKMPILVMNADQASFKQCIDHQLEPAIFSIDRLEEFVKELIGSGITKYPVHIKLETGMHRLGFEDNELDQLISYLQSQPEVYIKSVYSHLATADQPNDTFVKEQADRFRIMSAKLEEALPYPFISHLLNSDGIAHYPELQFDMVRLGIGMYGIAGEKDFRQKLKPSLRWISNISQIKQLNPGDSVGYSRQFVAEQHTVSATIPVGYADGFRRSLSKGIGGVYFNGKFCPTLGNVCMDMIMVDITGLEANEGDLVEIIGQNQTIDAFATRMNTIAYEVMTGFSNRLPRVYING